MPEAKKKAMKSESKKPVDQQFTGRPKKQSVSKEIKAAAKAGAKLK
jgi:hypothetical protein